MNIIILGVRIIKDSDNRGSDNRGCTVYGLRDGVPLIKLIVLCFVLNFFARNPSIPQICKCSYLILFSSLLSYQVLS